MNDYKKLYYELFNEITKAIELLKSAQQKAEESYISACDIDLSAHSNDEE